jgi:hypothetical protein
MPLFNKKIEHRIFQCGLPEAYLPENRLTGISRLPVFIHTILINSINNNHLQGEVYE